MKKLKRCLLISGTILLLFFAFHTSAHAAYQYYRSITVTSTASVASGTQANFPMLVNIATSTWLKTTSTDAVNGRIQNAQGYDIVFSTSTACTNPLNYERERYTSSTGELVAWINEPTLATGTVTYMCYGNLSITTDQTNASGTWDANYSGVWHLPDGTTLSALDSTVNANNGVSTGVTAGTGRIDGAASSSGNNNVSITGPVLTATTTLSGWVNPDGTRLSNHEAIISDNGGNNGLQLYGSKADFVVGGKEGATTTYTGIGNYPYGIAFDGTNMWTANDTSYSVTKVSPTGAMTTYPGTGAYPYGIAFDGTNMWTVNFIGNSVTKVSPTGATTTYTGTGNGPYAIAFDGTNMWTANSGGNSVTKFSPTGATTTYTGTGTSPRAIAFDGTNMWTANWGGSSVTKVSPTGTMTTYTGTGTNPRGIAFDGTNMWTANLSGNSVTKVSPTGTMATYTGTGNSPRAIAFDGTNMWTADSGVTKFSPTGATTTYTGTGSNPYGIAFDGTNMWTANYGDGSVTKVAVGAYSSSTISSSTWTYVAATIDASNNYNIYVNGVLDRNCPTTISSTTFCGHTASAMSSTMAYIMNDNTGSYFSGSADEVRVSNSVRSADWILTEYNNQNSPSTFYAIGNEVTIDNTPPVRSSGSPSGSFAYGMTSTTLSLTTDESSTCKYSTSASAAFASMTAFSSTASTTHQSTLSGLSSGQSYTYYVKCEDNQGNINSDDYQISFAVSGPTVFVGAGQVNIIPPASTSSIISTGGAFSSGTSDSASSTAALMAEIAALKIKLAALQAQLASMNSSLTQTFTRNLGLWSTGNDVKNLQLFLTSRNSGPAAEKLKSHGATTVFGFLTYNALKEFQKAAGITPASGYFGPKTRAYVNARE